MFNCCFFNRNTIKRRYFPASQPLCTPTSADNSRSPSYSPEETSHYKIPRPLGHTVASINEEEKAPPTNGSKPLSPEHYEVGPCFTNSDPIYENTEFDDTSAQKETILYRPIYQNMEFEGSEQQQQSTAAARKQEKAGADQKMKELDLDDDYINPEEFKLTRSDKASATTSSDHSTQKPTTPGVC